MAEQPQPTAITAIFPAPPPFYKSFTPENLERQREYVRSNEQSSLNKSPAPAASLDLLSLPPELRNLFPPPPPPDGKYRSFGQELDISPTPPSPPQPASTTTPSRLNALTQSLLLSFLHLTHALATDPGSFAPIWDNMKASFEEIHTVINGYRPHQARETLILMMEEQLEKVRGETRTVEESMRKARGVVEELARGNDRETDLEGGVENGTKSGKRDFLDRRKKMERHVWEVIEREVGTI